MYTRPRKHLTPAPTATTLWTLSGILLAACGGGGGGGGGPAIPGGGTSRPNGKDITTPPIPPVPVPFIPPDVTIRPASRVDEQISAQGEWQTAARITVRDRDDALSDYTPANFRVLNALQGEYRVRAESTEGQFRIETRGLDFEHDSVSANSGSTTGHGRVSFALRIRDASKADLFQIASVSFNLYNVNEAPEITVTVTDGVVVEDSDPTAMGRIVASDPDSDDTVFTYHGRLGTNGFLIDAGGTIYGDYGTLALDTDGSWEYTLTSQNPGAQEVFTFIARDDGNGESEEATVTIHITAGNDDPFLTLNAGGDTNVNELLDRQAAGSFYAGDSDDTLASLTYLVKVGDGAFTELGSDPVVGTYGDITIDRVTQTWIYRLDQSRPATTMLGNTDAQEEFTLRVRDDDGAESGDGRIVIDVEAFHSEPVVNVHSLADRANPVETVDPMVWQRLMTLVVRDPDGVSEYLPEHLSYTTDTPFEFRFVDNIVGDGLFNLEIRGFDYEHSDFTNRPTISVDVRVTDYYEDVVSRAFRFIRKTRDIDEPPQVELTGATPIAIDEGAALALDAGLFRVTDPDAADNINGAVSDFTRFTVSNPVNGAVVRRVRDTSTNWIDVQLDVQSAFTLGELRNGLIGFRHDDSDTTTASFTVQVSGPLTTGNTVTVNFAVTPENENPVITTGNTDTTVASATDLHAGGTFTASDEEDVTNALVYWIAIGSGNFVAFPHNDPFQAVYGAFSLNPRAGTWSYELQPGRAATIALTGNENPAPKDVIHLRAQDTDNGYSATATIEISVTGRNDPPTIVPVFRATAIDEKTDPRQVADLLSFRAVDPDGSETYAASSFRVISDSAMGFDLFATPDDNSLFLIRPYNINHEDPGLVDGVLTYEVVYTDPRDATITSTTGELTATINDINEAPTLTVAYSSIDIANLGRVVFDNTILTVRDPDAGDNGIDGLPNDEMVFTVGQTAGGVFRVYEPENILGPWVNGTTFTLGDLRVGHVAFERTILSALSNTTSFTVKVADDEGLESGFVTVNFNVVSSAAPTLTSGASADASVTENTDASAGGSLVLADTDSPRTDLRYQVAVGDGHYLYVNGGADVNNWGAAVPTAYGSFTLDTANDEWTYALDDTNAAVDALNDGETLQDIINVRARDAGGRASEVLSLTITINGATDALPVDPGGSGDSADFGSAIHDVI